MILLLISLVLNPAIYSDNTIGALEGLSYSYDEDTQCYMEGALEDSLLFKWNELQHIEYLIWDGDSDNDTLWVEDYEFIGFRNKGEVITVIEIEELK